MADVNAPAATLNGTAADAAGRATRGRRAATTLPGLQLSTSEASRLAAELDALATSIEQSSRSRDEHGHDGASPDPITTDRVEFLRDQAGALRTLHGGEA